MGISEGIKIRLNNPDDFLVVKETLTRMGVISTRNKTLYQTAHILHKKGEYFILHFKELFLLDGKTANISQEDYDRRNLIAKLLLDWGIIEVVEKDFIKSIAPISSIRVLSFKEKDSWILETKYTIGSKGKKS